MVNEKPKVICIGPEAFYNFFKNRYPQWEFNSHLVSNVGDEFWDAIESGKVDATSQIVILPDLLFDPTGKKTDFEEFVAEISQFTLTIIPVYRDDYKARIEKRVEDVSQSNGQESSKYYFIRKDHPVDDINIAIEDFIKTSDQTENVSILSGGSVDVETRIDLTEDEEPEEDLGKIVTVTSSKGGSGKSTVALTVATCIGHAAENSLREGLETEPYKVVLVDLDVEDGQLGFMTGEYKPTITALKVNGISRETIKSTVIHKDNLKIDILLAPKNPRNAANIEPEFYFELIKELRRMYDLVILDTSVKYLDPLFEKVAYPMSDAIVFVTESVKQSRYSMTRWIKEVTKPIDQGGSGIERDKIGIVINKALPDIGVSNAELAEDANGLAIITAIPSSPTKVAQATNEESMEKLLQHPYIAPSVYRLAKAMVGKTYKLSKNLNP